MCTRLASCTTRTIATPQSSRSSSQVGLDVWRGAADICTQHCKPCTWCLSPCACKTHMHNTRPPDTHARTHAHTHTCSRLLAGNMARSDLQPLVEQYLASIPAAPEPAPKPTTQLAQLRWRFPEETVVEECKVPGVWVQGVPGGGQPRCVVPPSGPSAAAKKDSVWRSRSTNRCAAPSHGAPSHSTNQSHHRPSQVSMVSAITQAQVTFPVRVARAAAKEDLVWLKLVCQLLETRLLQRMRFVFGKVYTVGGGGGLGTCCCGCHRRSSTCAVCGRERAGEHLPLLLPLQRSV